MEKVILLIEDSADDELLFRHVVRQCGLANPILVAHDGDEATAYLKGERQFADREKFPLPDVLFLDLKLPKISGFDLLLWMKTQPHLSRLLVVVLSHLGETDEIRQAYFLGAHSFLTKPVTQADIQNLANHFSGRWILALPGQILQTRPHLENPQAG